MKRINQNSIVITARVQSVHKTQLEELATSERRTRSSMIRCLIERAYRDFVKSMDVGKEGLGG